MPQPTAAEVLPKALARETLPAVPAAGSAEALAATIIKKADEGAGREGLELARRTPIEDKKITERIEEIGGFENPRLATGAKQRSHNELARYNEAKQSADLVKKYLEKGYDGLNATEKNGVLRKILIEVNARPALATELGITPTILTGGALTTEQSAHIERMLKNPKYSVAARRFFEELLDPSRKLADAVTPAQEALEEAKFKRDDKQAEFDEVDRRWSANDRNLAQFEDRTGAGGARGGKLDELETLTRDEATIKAELTVHQQRLRTAKDRADELTAEKNTVQATMLHRGGYYPDNEQFLKLMQTLQT